MPPEKPDPPKKITAELIGGYWDGQQVTITGLTPGKYYRITLGSCDLNSRKKYTYGSKQPLQEWDEALRMELVTER